MEGQILISFPISIVEKNGDIASYNSLREAEISVEAVDVLNNEYQVFDSSGKQLSFFIEKEIRSFLFGFIKTSIDVVKIRESQQRGTCAHAASSALIRCHLVTPLQNCFLLNCFAYVDNNPLWATDPWGLAGDNPNYNNPLFNPTHSIPAVPSAAVPIVPKELGNLCPAMEGGGAQSPRQGANLSKHLKYSQEYGQAGTKTLQDGRIRYYKHLTPPRTPGQMVGQRYVHEFNPTTGQSRGWMESLDKYGNIRQIRPQIEGAPKTHYIFDASGKYTGSW